MDTKGTLNGIFTQISNGDETTRERCFKFLVTKFKLFGPDVITKEIEEYMITEIKKILQVKPTQNFLFDQIFNFFFINFSLGRNC